MKEIRLTIPDGFDADSQHQVGIFASQLDNQMDKLLAAVEGLSVAQLEWQMQPGMNTIGMLLAHVAVVNVFWILVAPKGIAPDTEGNEFIKGVIGIRGDEDGLPLEKSGRHPENLSGKSLADYTGMLESAQRAIHKELRSWDDTMLEPDFTLGDRRISRAWVLYHVIEHLASHLGQILLLKHIMRDTGVIQAS
ncbi:MAG: DinB family protein [Candidatus Thorarchaeota archaeon]